MGKAIALVVSIALLIALIVGMNKIADDTRVRAIENGIVTEDEAYEVDGKKTFMVNILNRIIWGSKYETK